METEIKDNIQKKVFPILNMSCAACAVSVESILKNTNGVNNASVNFAGALAKIEYDSDKTNPVLIRENLQKTGYDLYIDESEDEEDELEKINISNYSKLRNNTTGAIVFSLPVFVISMFYMDIKYANYIMWIFSTPVVCWMGKDFYINAYRLLLKKQSNMDTLVALSTATAYIFSIFNTLFDDFWHNRGLHAHVYFEASSVVIAFILIGKMLEEKAKGNTAGALKELIKLKPKTVNLILPDKSVEEIPVKLVKVGDTLLVRPGENIAVDGIVISGNSFIDESMLSGEPIAVEKSELSKVWAGTINQKGTLYYKAEKIGSQTILSQIILMIKESQSSKSPYQKLADKISGIFVPIVISIAVVCLIIWLFSGNKHSIEYGFLSFVNVLIISCPCALGLATPTAIMVGIGIGAKRGILIKDAESLELAHKINSLVIDKTGTITEGKPTVTNEIWLNEDEKYKKIIVAITRLSDHPLSKAILEKIHATDLPVVENFINIPGMGNSSTIDNKQYYTGNLKLVKKNDIKITDETNNFILNHQNTGSSLVFFTDNEKVISVFALSDKIKETSAKAITQIRNKGIDVIMLTGDNYNSAKAVANIVNIDNFKAEVMPEGKTEYIKKLHSESKIVAMAGDGINDSAALAAADVSIAMGKGSDIAIGASQIIINSSDLLKIEDTINLSSKTVNTINQNLFWAFIYNIIAIPIAAGLLFPINGFLLDPMIAGAAMALSSVCVVSNSLLLKLKKI
ncbi:MAG: copper-translocating P-type ATPase [Bacteroidia bacterium]|nr:copper-translocating P-type ATPase [Bacteroidia bacterium]